MGTIVAPTYEVLEMGYLEIQFYKKYNNEFGKYNENTLKKTGICFWTIAT